jgi:predicted ATPase
LDNDRDDQARQKLERAVSVLVEDEAEAGWITRNLLPLIGLVGNTVIREGADDEAFAAWRRFLEALAEHGPTILVFEDLHWADDGLLDFIDHLTDWTDAVPLFVLCTARPELLGRRPGWGGGKPNAATISLPPL